MAEPSVDSPSVKGRELDLSDPKLSLSLYPSSFAVIRMDPDVELPRFLALNISKPSADVPRPAFLSVTRTLEETSIVTSPFLSSEQLAASGFPTALVEGPYRCIRVKGPLALTGYVGTMARLSRVIKDADISIFALSSYDT